MRRRIVLITVALFVTLCFTIVRPIAQQPVVDSQKSRQELQTMEGILSTTLGFAVQRLNGRQAAEGEQVFKFRRMDGGDVNGYYVYGQGAVFMIPISSLQRNQEMDFAFALPDIDVLVEPAVEMGLAAAVAGMEAAREVDTDKANEKAEKLQQQAEERKKNLTEKIEKQKEKMQQFQEQAKRRRAEIQQRRKELIGRLDQVKVDLKDALARYGDSLSIVKPEESVTIILSDEGGFKWGDMEGGANICHVLTVKKSLATDLKSGKITREEFDRRVVDYSY
jgi:hypothetical protein